MLLLIKCRTRGEPLATWATARLVAIYLVPINRLNSLLSVRSRTRDSVATREVLLEKKADIAVI